MELILLYKAPLQCSKEEPENENEEDFKDCKEVLPPLQTFTLPEALTMFQLSLSEKGVCGGVFFPEIW